MKEIILKTEVTHKLQSKAVFVKSFIPWIHVYTKTMMRHDA